MSGTVIEWLKENPVKVAITLCCVGSVVGMFVAEYKFKKDDPQREKIHNVSQQIFLLSVSAYFVLESYQSYSSFSPKIDNSVCESKP